MKKTILAGTGLAIMLFMPAAAQQQGQQTTDEQKSFQNNVQAEPTTKKRQDIIRSESDKPDAKATVGTGAKKQ